MQDLMAAFSSPDYKTDSSICRTLDRSLPSQNTYIQTHNNQLLSQKPKPNMENKNKNSNHYLHHYCHFLPILLLICLRPRGCGALGAGGGGCGSNDGKRALFVFGDSYADTGNLGNLGRELTRAWYYPYGVTFPGRPSGRFSNGRVLTDFVASLLGIPTPVAYKLRRGRRPASARGMNFAVGGSGVLDTGNFQRNVSAQIDLLEAQMGRGGAFSGCDLRSGVALVVVSGNDYSAVAERDNSTSAALGYVPKVVRQMGSDLRRLRDEVGMGKVMVTNLHPIGCAPLFSRALGYSSCDALANMGSVLHNAALQSLLHALDPANRTFLLLDLNTPFARFVSPPPQADSGEGKRFRSPRRPCCESFSSDGYCGEEDENGKRQYALCDDLDEHFYWDDVHPTQAAWAAVSALLAPKIRDFLSI